MSFYRVGYARVDITPTESVPLAGWGRTSQRMSRCVRDELYASCFAITDENDTTVILMSMDLQRGTLRDTEVVRKAVSEQFGIPANHIMVCGTHTHAAPDQYNFDEPSMDRYRAMLDVKLPACVALALADRQESRVYMGDVEAVGLNFVKHYCHTTPEGEVRYFGDNFGTEVIDETTRHATEADPTAHIVKFVREGRRDLVLVNFRSHGLLCAGEKKYDVSADLMGGLRSAFEAKTGMILTYFNGAAGNINPISRIKSEEFTEDCTAYGHIFANYIMQGMEHLSPLEAAPIETRQFVLPAEVNQPGPEELACCRAVYDHWLKTGDTPAALALGTPFAIRSPYQAEAVVLRAAMPATMDIELNAIALGELAIVTAPNELFDTISVYVEDHAPFSKVLTFGYANGMKGYIPSQFGFEYGCYESDCCKFKPGIGEVIRDHFLDLLRDIRKN